MQEDPVVRIALVPASSNQMGSHIISDRCVQRSCSTKLYALRTGRHGGQRKQRLNRPSLDQAGKNQKTRSSQVAYRKGEPLYAYMYLSEMQISRKVYLLGHLLGHLLAHLL